MLVPLLLSAAIVYAQTISLGDVNFDLSGCVSPSGTNACYQQAVTIHLQGQRACNATTPPTAECLVGVEGPYYQSVIGCITEGCWNKAYGCEFQYMLAAFEIVLVRQDSYPSNPPPFWTDYGGLPGSCVCNIPAAVLLTRTDAVQLCKADLDTYIGCDCCLIGSSLASLQTICPNNSLEDIGLSTFINEWQGDASQHCQYYQQSNWLDLDTSQCSSYGVSPANGSSQGFLNPLSLPAGWPATASLSNLPGTATALSQFNFMASTAVWSWGPNSLQTFTFSSLNAAATPAKSGSTNSASAQATDLYSTTITTGGMTTTLNGSGATKTSGAERILPPIRGLLAVFLKLY